MKNGYKRLERIPILARDVNSLCQAPYYGHPNGCPNYDKKEGCPPGQPILDFVLDMKYPVYVIWNKYNLGMHKRRMKRKHPNWTKRKLVCCLYWQATAKLQLKATIERFLNNHKLPNGEDFYVVKNPEAHGVNVTALMMDLGIDLEWPVNRFAYQIVLIGRRK